LISPKAVATVDAKVKQAVEMGSTLHLGGQVLSDSGSNFFQPTILSNVPLDADIWNKTETSGLVIAIKEWLLLAMTSNFHGSWATFSLRRLDQDPPIPGMFGDTVTGTKRILAPILLQVYIPGHRK
jgi:hypothetical protein